MPISASACNCNCGMMPNRLTRHLAPGGRLYIIGMNPIPDTIIAPTNIVSEVRRSFMLVGVRLL
jgi:hypothetical protein